MTDFIIVAAILVLVGVAAVAAVRHFKGQGGCCGGGTYRPRKKKLPRTLYTKTFRVEGMHCEHCKRRVEETVNDIPALAGKVNLARHELTVSYAEQTDDSLLKTRLERIGYRITPLPDEKANTD